MGTLLAFGTLGLDYALLFFLRVSGMTLSSPIFGRENIPSMAKICYSLALTWFFFTVLPQGEAVAYGSLLEYVLLCAKELLIGLLMGYLLTLFFSIAFVSGQLIDMQMSFGMANVFDEQSNASVPLLGNLLNFMMMLVFIASDGFERLIVMLNMTFRFIPVGQIGLNPDIAWTVAALFCESFVLGVRMAMPIVVAAILGEAALGVLARTVPQLNVFVLGLPLKVGLGFLILLAMLPVYTELTGTVFERMFAGMEQVFSELVGTQLPAAG